MEIVMQGTETTVQTPAATAAPAPVSAKPVVAAPAPASVKPAAKKASAPKTAAKAPVAAKPAAKAAAKPVEKPAAKTTTKPAVKTMAKTATKTAAKPAAKTAVAKPAKEKKIKMVRDSISIPKTEYVVLDEMKIRAGKLGTAVKKTELIRAGIKALAALSNTAFLAAVAAVPNLKTGRPAKSA
jgi:hypothetical protein